MRFVVLADTHVRSGETPPGDFVANASLAGRNEHAVELIEALAPDLVIHLGDVVHPVPGSAAHGPANDLATDAYRALSSPMFVVPGNHDVGDKPYRWVDAPAVAHQHYETFTTRYGPRYQSFSRGNCRFVLLDTPVLNTGWTVELEQWEWLEATLTEATDARERIFLFGHYPLYLWDPNEHEHYDNLAEPARSRLLSLISQHNVEAVFAGHVHRFFHRRHQGTDLYVAPATGFVRPEYAELDSVSPDQQFGRDDHAKLGLLVVDVEPSRHVIRPVRTWGETAVVVPEHTLDLVAPNWSLQLGVTMRQGWAAPKDLAMDGLDRFVRKRVRDDAVVLALWEARISRVRVPLADLQHSDSRERIAELGTLGTQFTVVVPGPELLDDVPVVDGVVRYEVVLERDAAWGGANRGSGVCVAVGPVVPVSGDRWSGDHFVAHGFGPEADPDMIARLVQGADEAVFRVPNGASVWDVVSRASQTAQNGGVGAIVTVQLPHLSEGRLFDDDLAVANRVLEAEIAARAHDNCEVILDGFTDRDRGYFPRHGLLDRRGDPRESFQALARFGALTADSNPWSPSGERPGIRTFSDGVSVLHLVGNAPPRTTLEGAVSLVDGRVQEGPVGRGPWLGLLGS